MRLSIAAGAVPYGAHSRAFAVQQTALVVQAL
jgi:hypothetical protein